ncbi:clotting factor C-like [Penaeus japonicus]|uniref:clotting factor C-like n=1 Tax=Penaeus japonicus TaxID=27405 RepID=UPI001C70EAF8|nr:clotting factor C-like [Penaeus japonicus]XP_042886376.1 clotting factor C-like [Penaeus japonicus]
MPGLGFLIAVLVFSCTERASSYCPTFKAIHADNLICRQECLKTSEGTVYGTLNYHEDSQACLAALHASVINESGGHVHVQRSNQVFQHFFGAIRNRIKSETK